MTYAVVGKNHSLLLLLLMQCSSYVQSKGGQDGPPILTDEEESGSTTSSCDEGANAMDQSGAPIDKKDDYDSSATVSAEESGPMDTETKSFDDIRNAASNNPPRSSPQIFGKPTNSNNSSLSCIPSHVHTPSSSIIGNQSQMIHQSNSGAPVNAVTIQRTSHPASPMSGSSSIQEHVILSHAPSPSGNHPMVHHGHHQMQQHPPHPSHGHPAQSQQPQQQSGNNAGHQLPHHYHHPAVISHGQPQGLPSKPQAHQMIRSPHPSPHPGGMSVLFLCRFVDSDVESIGALGWLHV